MKIPKASGRGSAYGQTSPNISTISTINTSSKRRTTTFLVGGEMWIDHQGRCHTVALPDPTEVMSTSFHRSFDQLLARGREAVAEAIEREEDLFYEERGKSPTQEFDEATFVDAAPPIALLTEPVGAIADLRQLVREIDWRWRLDALAALDDYLPQIPSGE